VVVDDFDRVHGDVVSGAGGQTLWRTTTAQPEWQPVLHVPTGSTDEIHPIYVSGSHGYALVTNGIDAHWFETHDAGVSWKPATLP